MKYNCGLDLSKGKRGVGPNIWGNFRHLLPYHKIYHECGVFHDIGRELKLIPKQEVDDKFFQLMLKKKKSVWAYIYYGQVTLFGFIFY